MSTSQLRLDLEAETFVVEFAGGGGACEGYSQATGRNVDAAVNHAIDAIAMHRMNHSQTFHYCQDVWQVDPVRDILEYLQRRKVAGAWFSPDCKHFSKAKGGALVDKRVRGLAWILQKWFARRGPVSWRAGPRRRRRVVGRGPACPRVNFLENVEEFKTWGPLIAKRCPKTGRVVKREVRDPKTDEVIITAGTVAAAGEHVPFHHQWLVPDTKRSGLYYRRLMQFAADLGGVAESRELRAYQFGAPTIRKRLFLIIRFDGKPIVWPVPSHDAPDNIEVQAGKRKPWRTIAECLDFALPCPSIFLTKAEGRAINAVRPLADATMARVAKGVDRYVLRAKKPFLVSLTHQGGDRTTSTAEPFRTVTGAHRGETALVNPTLAPIITEHANQKHQRNFPVDEPGRTQCANVKGGHFAVVSPYLVPRYGEREGQEPRTRPVDVPGPVVVPTGNGGSLAAVALTKFSENSTGHQPDEPLHTVMAGAPRHGMIAAHLTKFRAGAVGSGMDEPAPTVTANSFIKRPGGCAPMGLVGASVVKLRGDSASHAPGHAADEPAHTISAQGTHHGVNAIYLAQHNGGENGHQTIGHAATDPASTISSKGSQQQVVGAALVPYYGSEDDGTGTDAPGRTVTTRDRFGLAEANGLVPPLTPEMEVGARRVAAFLRSHGVEFEGEFATVGEYVIIDIGMRMLTPRELFRAQGFPESYVIDRGVFLDEKTGQRVVRPLTKTAQVRMCGNSVCPPVAAALIGANLPELILEEWRAAA